LLAAYAFENRVGAEAAGQRMHAFDRLFAALAHDVASAERFRQRDPIGMPAQDDDLLGAEAFGGDDTAQADGAVADDRNFLALVDLCRPGRMMAGPHHV
jgi:hypothetical protein